MRLINSLIVALVVALAATNGLAQSAPPAAPPQAAPAPGQAAGPPAAAPPATPAAPAATPPSAPVLEEDPAIRGLVQRVQTIDKEITDAKDHDDMLAGLRNQVEEVMFESTQIGDGLKPRLEDVKDQIEKLGPPPKPDQPAEAAPVAAERARLNALSGAISGGIKTVELTWVKARQLVERITDLRRTLFSKSLFDRRPSPFSMKFWSDVGNAWTATRNTIGYVGSTWAEIIAPKRNLVVAVLAAGGILWLLLSRITHNLVSSRLAARAIQPSFFERASTVFWVAPLGTLPLIIAAVIVYFGLDELDILYFWLDQVLWAAVTAVMIYAVISAIVVAVIEPKRPAWRLVPLADSSSRRLTGLLKIVGAVYASDLALAESSRALTLPLNIAVLQTVVSNVAISELLMCVLLTRFARSDNNGAQVSRHDPIWLKAPIWAVLFSIIIATLLGYVALGRFIFQQLVVMALVAVVSGLFYLAIRAFTREPNRIGQSISQTLETTFAVDARRRQTLARFAELALSAVLATVAIPFVLLQWGFSAADVRDWFHSAFFGFDIGQFHISIFKLLIGLVLFGVLVLLTRMFQRWLKDMLMGPEKVDAGIAHSVDAVIGYTGTVLSALVAISYAGFDVTNLAIVAGALSVGIGFGLQSIVNNFVSGLILLIERPVKVGDWIVVGGDEGYVRKISVRATEIETFDRSSVVIPNAELITGRVKNWTLRDAVGRIRQTVNVRYDSKPEAARDIMLKAALEHPDVLKKPRPFVTFDAFNPDSVTLSLNMFVGDVNHGGSVKSDISFALLNAMPAGGVDLMPPPMPGLVPATATGPTPIKIAVPIGYEADPATIRTALLDAVKAVPGVAPSPEPSIAFETFGSDGMTLSAMASAAVGTSPDALKTEMAFAIHSALKNSGVGHPTPQHRVQFADLEPLRNALVAAMEDRRRAQETAG